MEMMRRGDPGRGSVEELSIFGVQADCCDGRWQLAGRLSTVYAHRPAVAFTIDRARDP
jgi:hypothetical protein